MKHKDLYLSIMAANSIASTRLIVVVIDFVIPGFQSDKEIKLVL